MISGAFVFNLKASYGLPLDMALDRIINEEGLTVDWAGFIDAARENGWRDYQTIREIEHSTQDAGLPRGMSDEIVKRAKLYIMKTLH